MKNYMKLTDVSLLYYNYIYLDLPEYLADQLFIKNKIRVKFKKHLMHPNYPYVVIFCKIRKRDEEAFLKALDELTSKMMIFEHRDYEQCCKDVFNDFDK
jgi:hypothetical protein